MTIYELSDAYEAEQDVEKKEVLRKLIVQYCKDNPDKDIPMVAQRIRVRYKYGLEK